VASDITPFLEFVIRGGSAEAHHAQRRGATPVIAAKGAAKLTPVTGRNHDHRVVLQAGLLLLLGVVCASAAEPKRVLIVNSFGTAAPPFTVHSMAFERGLVERMRAQVDLDEVSLDMARYAEPDMQEAIVEYLQKRQAKWRPDLVGPIGSPAGVFVAKYRDRLFPDIPILYTSLDQRLLPPGALEKNAAYIGQIFNIPALIEDMLRVAPATKNIAVVIGATPLELYWKEAFRKASDPYADRITFTYFNDLSFDQMLERVATLPPDSYIFVLLLLRDSAGITPNADEALKRLHAVANAPINSIFEHQLGLGIVGGRLYQGELIGTEAAEMAARILQGEPASSFPPKLIDALPPHYDWRELKRWKIDEKLLPPGSTILYRTPSLWEEHRALIIGGISICVLEGLLIAGLVVNLVRRRRAERSLTESEERIALAAEAAQLGAWELAPATNRVWTSEKICELFHFEPGREVTYADFQARVHPEDRAEHDAAIRRAIETGGGYDSEFRILLPDGNIRWLAGRARCVHSGDHTSKRLLGVSMDVTKRKEAEDLFRLATEASPSGTLLLDSEGRIVLVNSHVEELFGYPRDELIGQSVDVLMPECFERHQPGQRASFLTAIASGKMAQESFARRKDRTEFPAEIGLNPITTQRGTLALATVVDISARKAAEAEARHQREQVELLGRVSLLGEMTASLAHELNQPLSAIVSNADAAMHFLDKGHLDPNQLREIMTDVVADAGRAHDIIQGVRNAVKKGTTTRRQIDLNELIESVIHMVQHDAAAQSCKVRASLAPDLPAIDADPTQLQQVLINLINNAVEAMRDGPPQCRSVQIATGQNGDGRVQLEVSDTGPGFLPGEHARIFEHFFTTKKDGLGMGLAIVQSIVKAHGGKIEAQNVPGGGARFRIHLPPSGRTGT
jgi:PAS domain S-box-containing protein